MIQLLKYRGREVTEADAAFLRELITCNPKASRRALSHLACQAWNWVQPNGAPRDMVCRGLMLALHRAGHIVLPAPRYIPAHPPTQPRKPTPVAVAAEPIRTALKDLLPLTFRQVRRTAEEATFNGLIQAHHYLGYTQPVGEHLKYLVYAQERLVACVAWSSAPRHLGPRDRFVGWSPAQRRANLHLVAYNTRFLLLPFVKVPHLASHLLAQAVRQLSADWERLYAHPIYLVETFIDPERFRGTCYRAANWIYLGLTTGRGKDDQTHRPNRSLKELWAYPLRADFRRRLGAPGHG